jgi:phenylacetate-CoA ligase
MALLMGLRKHILVPLYETCQGANIQSKVPEIEGLLKKPGEELKLFQLKRLKKLLFHAYETVPYYSKLFKEMDFNPNDVKSIDDLTSLPLLSKDKIRELSSELLSKSFSTHDLDKSATGGTTDVPITYYRNRGCGEERWAITDAFNRWYGWDKGSKVAYLWGAAQDFENQTWKTRLADKVIYNRMTLQSSILNRGVLEQYLLKVITFKPDVIQAYPSSMEILARFALERGYRMPKAKAIILTAEPLYKSQRSLIESVFHTKVYNQYGSRETGLLATECDHGGMHLNIISNVIEVIQNDRGKDSDAIGEIIVTDLANYGMPFIRYKIGDIGSLSSGTCPCGSGLPLLNSLDGRTTDVFVLPNGSLVPGVSLTGRVVNANPHIKQLQIIQEEISQVRVNVVKADNFTDQDLVNLKKNLRNYFPENVDIDFLFVADLEKEKSGKIRFCANRVKPS